MKCSREVRNIMHIINLLSFGTFLENGLGSKGIGFGKLYAWGLCLMALIKLGFGQFAGRWAQPTLAVTRAWISIAHVIKIRLILVRHDSWPCPFYEYRIATVNKLRHFDFQHHMFFIIYTCTPCFSHPESAVYLLKHLPFCVSCPKTIQTIPGKRTFCWWEILSG